MQTFLVKVVEEMGKEKSIEIYKETKQIEYDGGMPILVSKCLI